MRENKLNVLSLFDGMSCGQQALERAGFNIENYFASEIDKYAIQVTMVNYPNTKQLGSVVNVDGYSLPKIDLLLGGSPCQSFSFAGKRNGMSTKDEQEIYTLEHYLQLKSENYEFEGQSYLFWEYMRILNEVKPKYFLLENVEMGEKWEKILNKAIGIKGIHINSSLVSAQNRKRIYWTNIGLEKKGLFGDYESIVEQPKDKGILLKDILEDEVDKKYYINSENTKRLLNLIKDKDLKNYELLDIYNQKIHNNKSTSITAQISSSNSIFIVHNLQKRSPDRPSIKKNKNAGGSGHLSRQDGKTYCLDSANTQAVEIKADEKIRKLTPLECERLQTVNDNYTNHVKDSQRYKMLGNGWTIDVIAHILKYIK
jgi:DNA (cytosine-5)-methyltransferase 3A